MLDSMGYETGIDLTHLIASRDVLADALPGEPLYGYLARAGVPKQFARSPAVKPSSPSCSQVLQ
jgi:hydroxymethylglutaryl-CoA lyase